MRDDISGTGSRIGINEKAFQRARFDASDDRLPVDKESVFSELRRFKVSSIFKGVNRASDKRLKIIYLLLHDRISATGYRIEINKKVL